MRTGHSIFVFCLLTATVLRTHLFAQDFRIPFRDKNLWGLADTTGKLIMEAKYDSIVLKYASPFYNKNNRWIVASGGKFGVINNAGDIVIPVLYNNIFFISINSENHYHLMLSDGVVSRTDMNGNPKVQKKYIQTDQEEFHVADAKKRRNEIPLMSINCDIVNAKSFIEKKSNAPPPPMFYHDEVDVAESKVLRLGAKMGMMLRCHNRDFIVRIDTIPPIYDDIKVMQCNDDYYILKKDGKWGIYDLKKKTFIVPIENDSIAIINHRQDIGLYRSGKLGFLGYDEYGNYATYIEPEYDAIRTFVSVESMKQKRPGLQESFAAFGVIWFLRDGKICPVGQNGVKFFGD
jgi:hypothetical protein